MKFHSKMHEQQYNTLLARMKRNDPYHRSAAYLMALADLVPSDMFDFEEDGIRHEGIFAGWQTSSSRRATRLMYNLWNGWTYEEEFNPDHLGGLKASTEYAVDNIFCDFEYAPFSCEAIRVRFEWI